MTGVLAPSRPGTSAQKRGYAVASDPMKISQRVYFAISSETVSAATVTAHLGIEPDELRVRASNRTQPPRPPQHSWSLHCREYGLTLDAQISKVLARIEPVQTRLRDLITSQDVSCTLVIVRDFDDPEGEDEHFEAAITKDGKLLEKLPGQHQLLGWFLTHDQLGFLASIGCSISADEYG